MASTTSGEAVALRAELYTARRLAGALQKDLDAVTAERDRLLARLEEGSTIKGEHESMRASLDSEVAARKAAEEESERVHMERQRLQKARDELATTLLAMQQRASEAEEDQQRAEQQAMAAVAELRQLQLQQQSVDSCPQADVPTAAPGVEHQVEAERNRNAVLMAALSSAKAERDAALMEAAAAGQQQLGLAELSVSSSALIPDGGVPNGPASVARSEVSLDGARKPEKALASLQRQVAQLRASRDKLIAQVSTQLADSDRMSVENTALAQALEEARQDAGKWERHFQEALGQQERLKDLLEESALWQAGAVRPGDGSSKASAEGRTGADGESNGPAEGAEEAVAGPASKSSANEGHLAALEQRYVQECARAAGLDIQVRALCAELTRAAAVTSDLGRSVLPALAGVEARLLHVLQLKAGR